MDIHWRNSQKPARFFFLDARSFLAIFLCLAHLRIWTFCVAVLFVLAFWVLERRGLTFESALRGMRSWFLGRKRPANSRRAIRRMVDYG